MQLPDPIARPVIVRKSSHLPGLIIVSVFLLTSLAANIYMGHSLISEGKIPQFSYRPTTPTPTPTPSPQKNPSWKSISLGEISFDYPIQWHASYTSSSNSLLLYIDPNPTHHDITDIENLLTVEKVPAQNPPHAPKALSPIEYHISLISKLSFKKINQETIESKVGEIYRVTATYITPSQYDQSFERYFIAPKDSPNLYMFSLAHNENKDYAKILKEMIESIKFINEK